MGALLALAADDYTLILVDLEAGQVVRRWITFPDPLGEVRFTPSGELVVAATKGGTVWGWQVASEAELRRLDLGASLPPGQLLYLALAFLNERELLLTLTQRVRLEPGQQAWFTASESRVLVCQLPGRGPGP